jgi:DNA mismatch endonuclease, patch repair protein
MADIVPPETRSRMMAGIKGRDTKPEVALRSGLHRLGLRFTLGSKLPGKPDMVFPRHRVAVFFHGCFWHGHEGCALFRLPGTRTEFWEKKIGGNRERDRRVLAELAVLGWRIGVVRECSIRGRGRRDMEEVCSDLAAWIRGSGGFLELEGMDRAPGV